MTKTEQRKLLRAIIRGQLNHLLAQSARWPRDWDGHELRELIAEQANHERTRLMRESTRRRQAAANAILIDRLY